MICFAKRGFHQTSMHDISAEAGISVGLIYRYFKNKEEVIAALAAEHKKDIADLLERAGQAPTLLEAMEILFTSHCCEHSPQIISAFVVDLFAEASRNPRVAKVVRDVSRDKGRRGGGLDRPLAGGPAPRALARSARNCRDDFRVERWHDDAQRISSLQAVPSRGSENVNSTSPAHSGDFSSVELPMQTATTKLPSRPQQPTPLRPRRDAAKRARSSGSCSASSDCFSCLAGIKVLQIFTMISAGKKMVPPPTTVTSAIVKQTDWQPMLERSWFHLAGAGRR